MKEQTIMKPQPKRIISPPVSGTVDEITKRSIEALAKKNGRRYRRRPIRSVNVLSSSVKDGRFFTNEEPAGVKSFANYSQNCLISTPTGMLCTLSAKIYAPNLKNPDWVAGTTPYNVHSEIERLVNSIELEYYLDNKKRRDLRLDELHESLPILFKGAATGTPADTYRPVSALLPATAEKKILITSEISKNSTVVVSWKLPSQSNSISADLNDYLFVLEAVIAEEDN